MKAFYLFLIISEALLGHTTFHKICGLAQVRAVKVAV